VFDDGDRTSVDLGDGGPVIPMGTDRDPTVGDDTPTVSIDAFPDPILGYDSSGETSNVTRGNDAFEQVFAGVPAGTPVSEWLLTVTRAEEETVTEICSSLTDGRPVDTTVPVGETEDGVPSQEEYRLRTLDGVEGYLLATPVESPDASAVEVDRIASVISHDLRNPLDVANAHLRAARETGAEEHFDQIEHSHDRMERIVQDVLTLARGEHVLDVTADVDVGTVANDAWATVETGSASLVLDDDLPVTDADPDRLQRLFENLFRNAVEHARPAAATNAGEREGPESHRTVRVTVGRTNDGFFVADDGVGISAEERDRVFDPGYSGGGTNRGTGLGLTIVARIAEAHGWTVSLVGGSTGGARFEFHPATADD
jgi:signal transduction histidine kinase